MCLEPYAVVQSLWHDTHLPPAALARIDLPGTGPVLPSSFAVAVAAQSSLAAAGLAAAQIGAQRTPARASVRVSVERRAAVAETTGWFTVGGVTPDQWAPLSGLYPCGAAVEPGWVRIHANFAHHRDGALRLLDLATSATRADVERALRDWRAIDYETAAAQAGVAVAAVRSFEQWDALPQGRAVAAMPLVSIERIGDAAPRTLLEAVSLTRPLDGVRVLDLTRILAGPVAGRTLAASGADVMLVNSPMLPNIDSIAETSRGKRSVHIELKNASGRETLRALVREAHVFQQGYRPDALAALGFAPAALAELCPGIVCVSLSAYGHTGPWSTRRGFDSLVQTASGFNVAEAQEFGEQRPKALPVQILDYSAGFLMAFGALAALHRQMTEGGSWHVQVSLARVGVWLRSLGRVPEGIGAVAPAFDDLREQAGSGFGPLAAIRHAVKYDAVPTTWPRPSMPPGSHPAAWLAG